MNEFIKNEIKSDELPISVCGIPSRSIFIQPVSGSWLPYQAVVIGVSSGGMDALRTMLPILTWDFRLAVIVVQHLHPHSENFLVRYLHEMCQIFVKEADEKEQISPGGIYIAPPNYHLLIEHDKTFSLSTAPKINYARPSIDILFETAADAYRSHLVGIILTGANNDGSRGLHIIKEYGGLTIVQDPATAETAAMPEAAIKVTHVDYILSLQEIGWLLNTISSSQKP